MNRFGPFQFMCGYLVGSDAITEVNAANEFKRQDVARPAYGGGQSAKIADVPAHDNGGWEKSERSRS
jgi:hypothetical protein